MELLQDAIQEVIADVFGIDHPIVLTIPDEQFGDFACNVALQLAGRVGKAPREIAEKLQPLITALPVVDSVAIAGPGFLNICMQTEFLSALANQPARQVWKGKTVVCEYSCPNYFKELHAGHLYQTILGDSVARLLEHAGAQVQRTNFGGDVGLHVAKAIYGMNKNTNGTFQSENYSSTLQHMHALKAEDRAPFLASSYVVGSADYESDLADAKQLIEALNADLYKTVFSKQAGDLDDVASTSQREIHTLGRQWSREYFDRFYERLQLKKQQNGTFFRYYPESETARPGESIVQNELLKGDAQSIFTPSDGAVVFRGEDHGLHTRVFLTKQGLPTYETKDLGLIFMESKEFSFDYRILITGSDQKEYMKVVWKVADLLEPGIGTKMTHMTNGIIKFGDGKKMSSRLGNVTRAVDILDTVQAIVSKTGVAKSDEAIMLGAVKYEFLKYRVGGDIAFDPEESVSTQGNSGPYLQYAHARASSILHKATKNTISQLTENNLEFDEAERSFLRKLSHYSLVLDDAVAELAPHVITTYLYELAQIFNSFYEHNRVIGDERETVRLALINRYRQTLQHGLELLGIHAPEQM
ncbi:MAG TPA: arginine--tRNA ligase [Candidatus Saccharibacteria bacterium]|nr:arginine--tRNA ligase [Candidatus Saccharibacteria bacterium]